MSLVGEILNVYYNHDLRARCIENGAELPL
jgi:hypothetical protein